MTDSQLISQFLDGSQAAFSELVRRHLDLVYSAARRQVRDPHVAEDVTQQVFVTLARKAPSLRAHRVLAAWLYNVTRYTALDAVKLRARRQRHETEAAQMAPQTVADPATGPESRWSDIEPVLDQAMSRLSKTDRAILLLRFWEDRTTTELAQTLGITDDSARKRLSRATDRLRNLLSREGASISASALVPLLSANTLSPAPAHLAAQISAAALNPTLAGASTAAAKGTATLMAALKAKSVVVAIVAFAALGGGIYVTRQIIAPEEVPCAPSFDRDKLDDGAN